ncbi:MAG: hypothetical protein R3E39_07020 [Anaerolineae bacterium]
MRAENSNKKESRLARLQRGQAMLEYWAVIPSAIMITIVAGLLAGGINNSFRATLNGLQQYCSSSQMVPTTANIFQHSIKSSASVYDAATNRTTVVYTVTSGTQPSISHWILGVPRDVADHVLQTSESWSWTDNDPTTGAVGMKFDLGYNPSGGTGSGNDVVHGNNGVGNGEDPQPPGNPPVNDGAGTSPGNPGNQGGANNTNNGNSGNNGNNGNGNGNNKARISHDYRSALLSPAQQTDGATETRYISITLEGTYQFANLTVTLKAGNTQVGTGTVSGPAVRDTNNNNNNQNSGSGSGDNGCA